MEEVSKGLKTFGKDNIQLQFVKRVFTCGKMNKQALDRPALDRFTFSGVETFRYDTRVLVVNSNKENKKYKRKET